MSDFNDAIIEEFRANGGVVERGGFGSALVLLHSVGARSGQARVSPVLALPQADGSWLIAASKAGAPEHPAWFANLRANPETAIEVGDGRAVRTVEVRAAVVPAEGHAAAWAQFTDRSDAFAQYQAKAGERTIPVVRLSPR